MAAFLHRYGSPDRAAAAVATRQLSVITTRQLALAGVGHRVVAGRVSRGLVRRLWRGVFLWGAGEPVPGALELAACLLCGPEAWVCNDSALWLWGLDGPAQTVELWVAGRHCRPRRGLTPHCTDELSPLDVTDVRGIPVTSAARTLFDLAARDDGDRLERALSDSFGRQLVTEREIEACLDRTGPRPGGPALRRLLSHPAITRSRGERLFRDLVRNAGLPRPRTNVVVAGKRVDAWWPDHNLVVEFDGYDFHGHRLAFEADRATDQRLVAAGYRVMRITWRQLTEQPLRVAANLAAALARVPPRVQPQ